MKDSNDIIANKLREIDISKIPKTVYIAKKRTKVEKVFLYISEVKKFMCVEIKQLKKKKMNIQTIMIQNNLNIFNAYDNVCYYFHNIDEFKKDYPHSAIETFEEQDNIRYNNQDADKYLMRYAWLYQKYNVFEQLIKSGLSELVYSLIYWNTIRGYVIENIFNVDGKNLCQITGLKKSLFRVIKDNVKDADRFIEIKRFLNKYNVSAQQLTRLINLEKDSKPRNYIQAGCVDAFNNLLSIKYEQKHLYKFDTLINYVEKQSVEQGFYTKNDFSNYLQDYIKMCIEMNTKPNTKTKNLLRDYNVATVQYCQMIDKDLNEQYKRDFALQYQKLKEYEYQDNRLKVIVPKEPKDIIEEGKNNHNCAGSLVDTHAKGESFILFIRKISNENKSYITLELDCDCSNVIQAYYSYNKDLNSADNVFIKKWIQEIKYRRSFYE